VKKLIALVLPFLLTACAQQALNVQVWVDPGLPDAAFSTYHVETDQNEQEHQRISAMLKRAIESAMREKGYRPADSAGQSDLLVRFAAFVTRDQQLRTEEIPTPRGPYVKYRMVAVNEGELLINVIDRAADSVVWKGSSIRDMNNINPSRLTQERIDQSIQELLVSLPEAH